VPRHRPSVSALSLALIVCAGIGLGGCGGDAGSSGSHASASPAASAPASPAAPVVHPQTVEPVAGAAASVSAGPVPEAAGVSVETPGQAASLPKPQSNTDIRQELAESGLKASLTQATLTPGGLAVAPLDAPLAVQEVIAAGNEIARLPYRYGGGHMTYEDTAYDCSGSISYVFAAAGLLNSTVTSGELMNWGAAGPGKWITVFANQGHTFMYVAGLRFDTVALAQTGSRWSDTPANEPDLSTFSVRHPPGL
jgi:hypothetical protein